MQEFIDGETEKKRVAAQEREDKSAARTNRVPKQMVGKFATRGIGQPLTILEFRLLIRDPAGARMPALSVYPGMGTVRKNAADVPRVIGGSSAVWLTLGEEDPELEPLPDGSLWHSEWSRTGKERMINVAIYRELAREYVDLLGRGANVASELHDQIMANREKAEAKGRDPNSVSLFSKPRGSALFHTARFKFGLLGFLLSEAMLGRLDENKIKEPLLEDIDRTDRKLFVETYRAYRKLIVWE